MSLLGSLIDILAPAVCEVCRRPLIDGEDIMCLHCLADMPRTGFEFDNFNELHKRLAKPGLPIERAASMFYYFSGNGYAHMLQHAKYNGRPRLGERLGELYAEELAAANYFDGIDILMPMPLHWTKLIRRGYNQSEMICRGISIVTGIPIADNLHVARHKTQTRKGAAARRANTRGIFSVKHPEDLTGRHIMLVDDIVTTGSTLLGALEALHSAAPTAPLSVLTLGCTKLR